MINSKHTNNCHKEKSNTTGGIYRQWDDRYLIVALKKLVTILIINAIRRKLRIIRILNWEVTDKRN